MERSGSVWRNILVSTSWVPIALWVGTSAYLRPYDGWGAWAAAPLLLPAVALSLVLGTAGLVQLAVEHRRTGRLDWLLLGAAVLSASLFLYLAGARLMR